MQIVEFNLVRGDTWNGPTINFEANDFEFVDPTVRAELKDSIDGTLLHTFSLTPTVSDGVASVSLSIADTITKEFPIGTAVGDVEIYEAAFGRYTPVGLRIHVEGDVTV